MNGFSSFKGVGSGQLIIIAQKDKSRSTSHVVEWYKDGFNGDWLGVNQAIWDTPDSYYQFSLEEGNAVKEILSKCERNAYPLSFFSHKN